MRTYNAYRHGMDSLEYLGDVVSDSDGEAEAVARCKFRQHEVEVYEAEMNGESF